ncbi:acyl-CoA N-acyltransferase [Stipitochalara longipes BDJ]|nr:acyl-CoA N-acyltransferase [Stipitochalara longipes BDJ]
MTFTLRLATEADIDGLVAVWNSAFWQPEVQAVFPDTPTGRAWRRQSFERSMKTPSQHCTHMIITDDSEEGKGKVVAFGRWFRYAEGEFEVDWRTRWEPVLPEDMKIEMLGKGFFDPMVRQHKAVMGARAHYFLEVLATDKEYQKKGLGSRLLSSLCKKVDDEGLELYLDGGKNAQPLYEKFGFVEQVDKREPKAAAPMLRLAKKEK